MQIIWSKFENKIQIGNLCEGLLDAVELCRKKYDGEYFSSLFSEKAKLKRKIYRKIGLQLMQISEIVEYIGETLDAKNTCDLTGKQNVFVKEEKATITTRFWEEGYYIKTKENKKLVYTFVFECNGVDFHEDNITIQMSARTKHFSMDKDKYGKIVSENGVDFTVLDDMLLIETDILKEICNEFRLEKLTPKLLTQIDNLLPMKQ